MTATCAPGTDGSRPAAGCAAARSGTTRHRAPRAAGPGRSAACRRLPCRARRRARGRRGRRRSRLRAVYLFTAARPRPASRAARAAGPRHGRRCRSLAGLSFPAGRFEREMHDLYGIVPEDHPLPRRLVRHFHWPQGWYPMLVDAGEPPAFGEVDGPYPVPDRRRTRGVRDPGRPGARGHDRARALPVLRGRGDHPQPQGPALVRPPRHREAVRTAAPRPRASNWPSGSAVTPPSGTPWPSAWRSRTPSASRCLATRQLVRAVLLELERLYNHVADIGALCNDVGHSHPEHPRRADPGTAAAGQRRGHRAPAAARRDPPRRRRRAGAARPRRAGRRSARTSPRSSALALGHSVVRDRFTGTAVLTAEQAAGLGTLGYVARASGLRADARHDHPLPGVTVAARPRTAIPTATCWPGSSCGWRRQPLPFGIITELLARLDGQRGTASAGDLPAPGGPRSGVGHRRGLARHDRAPGRAGRRRGR